MVFCRRFENLSFETETKIAFISTLILPSQQIFLLDILAFFYTFLIKKIRQEVWHVVKRFNKDFFYVETHAKISIYRKFGMGKKEDFFSKAIFDFNKFHRAMNLMLLLLFVFNLDKKKCFYFFSKISI